VISIQVPEGWKISQDGNVIGPEITTKQSLTGNQDSSKISIPSIPEAGQPQPSTSDIGSSHLSESKEFDEKKYIHKYKDPKTGKEKKVRYGAKGYKIAPGTKKGDSYCARSEGDRKSEGYDCNGKDKHTPLCLSRKKWRCKGTKSFADTDIEATIARDKSSPLPSVRV
jgi:hypothetical protein